MSFYPSSSSYKAGGGGAYNHTHNYGESSLPYPPSSTRTAQYEQSSRWNTGNACSDRNESVSSWQTPSNDSTYKSCLSHFRSSDPYRPNVTPESQLYTNGYMNPPSSYGTQRSSSFLQAETEPASSSLNRFKNLPDHSGSNYWNKNQDASALSKLNTTRASFGAYDRHQDYNNHQYQNYNYNNDYSNSYHSEYGGTSSYDNRYNKYNNHRPSLHTENSAHNSSGGAQQQNNWSRPANTQLYPTNNSAYGRKTWPTQSSNSNFSDHHSDNKKPIPPAPKNNNFRQGNSKSFGSTWQKPSSSSASSTSSSTKITATFLDSEKSSLVPPNFEELDLPPIKKDFYSENDHLADRYDDEIDDYLDDHQVTLTGRFQPRPCMTFDDIDLPEQIVSIIKSKNFDKPTPIQAQSWPIALSGDDMVGLAQTGSGKTCAFVIPGLVHIINNKETPRDKNCPIMLVLCPTRELSQQVSQVTEEFAAPLGFNTVCVYGGAPRHEQGQKLEKQPEILVATPGRLIDFMESKQVDVMRVSYLVLDEADRMLDMGFEPQIRTIVDNIRPQRQTLMFSATWPDTVWQLAEDFLDSYTKVNIGSKTLSANHQITQIVECCEEEEKPVKILDLLKELVEKDKTLRTLIFCDTKKAVNELHTTLTENNFKSACIHGNKKQSDRELVLKQFADNQVPILIATDVAARGLDINDIKHVINYDYPNSSEDYVHRIGRTARSDKTGIAYTFFTQNNMGQSGKLISILEEANQEVPTMLKFYASFVKQR